MFFFKFSHKKMYAKKVLNNRLASFITLLRKKCKLKKVRKKTILHKFSHKKFKQKKFMNNQNNQKDVEMYS